MNRSARRAARRCGCWSALTADGSPARHAAPACDGSCHEGELMLLRPVTELLAGLPPWVLEARESVMSAPPGADFAMPASMFRTLALIAREDSARARAALLAALRERTGDTAAALFRRICAALGLTLRAFSLPPAVLAGGREWRPPGRTPDLMRNGPGAAVGISPGRCLNIGP